MKGGRACDPGHRGAARRQPAGAVSTPSTSGLAPRRSQSSVT